MKGFSMVFTLKQYEWLKEKSAKTGIAMTNIIKSWINDQIKKDSEKKKNA